MKKAMRWLLMGGTPSRRRWYAFRDRSTPYLDEWDARVRARLRKVGLTDASDGALDGTLVAAISSRHRMLNQERLRSRREELETAVRDEHAWLGLDRWTGRRRGRGPGWSQRPTRLARPRGGAASHTLSAEWSCI